MPDITFALKLLSKGSVIEARQDRVTIGTIQRAENGEFQFVRIGQEGLVELQHKDLARLKELILERINQAN
jgi:hypothetical protein